MYGRSENIMKISEKEVKENEAEKIKRRFNFFTSNTTNKMQNTSNESSYNPSSLTRSQNKYTYNYGELKTKSINNNHSNMSTVSNLNQNLKIENDKNYIPSGPVKINETNIVNNNLINFFYSSTLNNPKNLANCSIISSENETERKNSYNKYINPAVIDAIKNTSQKSLNSFNYDEVCNSGNIEQYRYNKSSTSMKDLIPSEDDIKYNKNKYNERVNLMGIRHYFNKSYENKMEDDLSVNEKESGVIENLKFDYFDYQRKKTIFRVNQAYDLSNRLINDECWHHHTVIKNPDCKFIEKIREEKKNFPRIKIKSILILSDDSIFNLLSFIFPAYENLIKSHQLFGKKICLTLNNKFAGLINSFKNKFGEVLELQEYYFKHTPFKKGKSILSVVDLVLKSKIITKEINTCLEISLTYFVKGIEFIQTWKLDIKKKGDIGFWFASEAEEYNRSIIRHCYYQPIVAFCKDDFVEMRINVFSHFGSIDCSTIQWLNLISYKTPQHTFLDYEKTLVKSNVAFDKVRYCELENIIHVWKNEKSLTKKDNIQEFKNYFQKNFKIIDINYDTSKFYIFKVKMQANSLGIVKKNKFTNVDIEIKPYNESLTNETQCLGLLNINHLTKKVELRISTYIFFYFTDLYL